MSNMASLICPVCNHELTAIAKGYYCDYCERTFPITDGIAQLLPEGVVFDSFEAKFFDFLFKMEQKHFWHIARREMLLGIIKQLLMEPGDTMLEIGCGNGSVLSYLRQNGLNIEGGDIFFEGLRYCRQRDLLHDFKRYSYLQAGNEA